MQDSRDEILGERLRSAFSEVGERSEPDFAAVYAEAGQEAGHPRRTARRILLVLPAAAALALVVNLGGDRFVRGGGESSIFREELGLLVEESVGPEWHLAVETGATEDPVNEELGAFVADLWNRSPVTDD